MGPGVEGLCVVVPPTKYLRCTSNPEVWWVGQHAMGYLPKVGVSFVKTSLAYSTYAVR